LALRNASDSLLAFFGDFGLADFRLVLMFFGNPGMMQRGHTDDELNANGDAGAISGDGKFVIFFF